jgi:sialate O-acetylesterase
MQHLNYYNEGSDYMYQNQSKIKLPRLISDGMIMQRNAQVKVWGWAPVGEFITVRFAEKVYNTAVNQNGEWLLSIRTEEAGGPYDMVIEAGKSDEKITIRNILMGDVWLCSGQSNMEMKMESLKDIYPDEISRAQNDSIRQFLVPVVYEFGKSNSDL